MAKKRHKSSSSDTKHHLSAKQPKASKKQISSVSHIHKKTKINIDIKKERPPHPIGIKVLIGYLLIILGFYLFYLFLGAKSPIAVLFGQVIGGSTALILLLFLIAVTVILIAGLFKRKRWSYYLSLAWFGFGIINSLISLVVLKPEVASFTRNFLILSSLTVFVIDILSILYIASEKNYFFSKRWYQKKIGIVDKLFVVVLIVFLVITIIVGGVLGYNFYKTNIDQTDQLLVQLYGMSYDEQINVCENQLGQVKDLCLLIVSIKEDAKDLCVQIQSDFYKFSCLQA